MDTLYEDLCAFLHAFQMFLIKYQSGMFWTNIEVSDTQFIPNTFLRKVL
jgi:hypothetical protein